MVTLCIPVLNRYDLLVKCINSANNGSMKPDMICIIDNGCTNFHIDEDDIFVFHPNINIGVAASWNRFIQMTTGNRIIVNDDIEFNNDTIEKMVKKLEDIDFTWVCRPFGKLNGFSCFGINDAMVEKVGYFDESISPNYAYFEDNDYIYRMKLLGIREEDFDCGAEAGHLTSSTLKAFNNKQMAEHNIKFNIAQNNYIKKWGGLPGNEKYKTPYNKE